MCESHAVTRPSLDERSAPGALLSSSPLRALVWGLALLAVSVAPLGAQGRGETTPAQGPRVLAYAFEHQTASDALALVRDMLSPMGTVELQPGDNTLVVRDHGAVLGRVEAALGRFDHPPRTLRFDIHLLRASNEEAAEEAPEEVVRRLREHLRWTSYSPLARLRISAREGEDVTYALGSRYGVSFRPGAMIEEALRLNDFNIVQKPRVAARSTNKSRQAAPRELIQTDLNLWREKQFTLVLSDDEASAQALAVVITFHPEDAE